MRTAVGAELVLGPKRLGAFATCHWTQREAALLAEAPGCVVAGAASHAGNGLRCGSGKRRRCGLAHGPGGRALTAVVIAVATAAMVASVMVATTVATAMVAAKQASKDGHGSSDTT